VKEKNQQYQAPFSPLKQNREKSVLEFLRPPFVICFQHEVFVFGIGIVWYFRRRRRRLNLRPANMQLLLQVAGALLLVLVLMLVPPPPLCCVVLQCSVLLSPQLLQRKCHHGSNSIDSLESVCSVHLH
jgi:hypothetical protein